MNKQSGFSRMSASVTKAIVDNVNSVLGILPKTMNFEVTMPKKTARRRSIKAKAHNRNTSIVVKAERSVARGLTKAKRAGVRAKKRVKTALTKAKKSARKAAPRKAVKRTRARNVIALKHKPVAHSSHARAA
ncbi:MAG: hypothetical protein ACXWQO_07820 [Bdellovibrionota bacterium]